MSESLAVATGRRKHQEKIVLNRRLFYALSLSTVNMGMLMSIENRTEMAQQLSDIMTADITPPNANEAVTLGQMAEVIQAWKDRGIGRESIEYVLDRVFWEGS